MKEKCLTQIFILIANLIIGINSLQFCPCIQSDSNSSEVQQFSHNDCYNNNGIYVNRQKFGIKCECCISYRSMALFLTIFE